MKHSMTNPTYRSWASMKQRCGNPNNPRYSTYRDISIDPAWWNSFDAFVADLGERPEGTVLDRKNNDGDYNKDNCRWATFSESQKNTSRSVLTPEMLTVISDLKAYGLESHRALSKKVADFFGVKMETVRNVFRDRTSL